MNHQFGFLVVLLEFNNADNLKSVRDLRGRHTVDEDVDFNEIGVEIKRVQSLMHRHVLDFLGVDNVI